MKKRRHAKILEIISSYDIETQEELQEKLKENEFDVTQATISRDIKELRLVKELSEKGRYIYSTGKNTRDDISKRVGGIFSESIVSIESAINMVVIKCFAGMANAACAAIDSMEWNGVVGTIAGDDTIMVCCKTEEFATTFTNSLEKILNA